VTWEYIWGPEDEEEEDSRLAFVACNVFFAQKPPTHLLLGCFDVTRFHQDQVLPQATNNEEEEEEERGKANEEGKALGLGGYSEEKKKGKKAIF